MTKFLEGYWQPTRFGHDIRRAQLSSLVVTGQMSREEALDILSKPSVSEAEAKEMFSEVARKLEISEKELNKFMNLPEFSEKFKSNRGIYNFGIRLFEKLGLEKRIRK